MSITISTFNQAVDFLYSLRLAGMKLGLENTQWLNKKLDIQHNKLSCIHVAGTNGKGSTCAFLESILRHCGYKTGLFTSPHLIHFNERIRINGIPINRENIIDLVSQIASILETRSEKESIHYSPTFFEATTSMTLKIFQQNHTDWNIIETGLGGRLDATNTVSPKLCIITSIGLDHQKWLGDSIEKIAFEKAGIIKKNTPLIIGDLPYQAFNTIKIQAKKMEAPLIHVSKSEAQSIIKKYSIQKLPIGGDHQRSNLALALKGLEILKVCDHKNLHNGIHDGLQNLVWPARMQEIKLKSGLSMTIDGAHNPDGIEALAEHIRSSYLDEELIFVLGFLSDRPLSKMLLPLAPYSDRIVFAPVPSERGQNPESLKKEAIKILGSSHQIEATSNVSEFLENVSPEKRVVVAGSLHFAGSLLAQLNYSPYGDSEGNSTATQALNDWHS